MTNTFEIRWAEPTDLKQISKISSLSTKHIRQILKTPTGISVVAVFNNKIIGIILYQIEKEKIIINNISVHSDFRNQKIGKELMNIVFSKLNKTRVEIQTEICEYNLNAHLFFKKLGFKANQVKKSKDGDVYVFLYKK